MPDRYDPKLSVRSSGDRRPADPHGDAAANDDPLAELARIVSGAGRGRQDAPMQRPRTSQAAPPDAPAPATSDPIRDLEAELLSDLQASFGAVRSTPTQPPQAPSHADPEPPEPPQEPSFESAQFEPQDQDERMPPEPEPTPEPGWAPPEMDYPEPEPTEPEPPAPAARPEQRPADFGLDELLRELQSPSFGQPDPEPPPQPEPPPPPRPEPRAVAPEPPQPAPEPPVGRHEPPEDTFESQSAEPEPSPEPQLPPETEATQQPSPPAPPPARHPAPPVIPPVMPPSPPAASASPRAPAVPPPSDARPGIRRAARPPIQPPPPSPGTAGTTAAPMPTPERLSAARGSQGAARTAETPTMAPVRGQSSRWEKPGSRAKAPGNELSRFAPPGAAVGQPAPGTGDDDLVDEEDLIVEDAPFLEPNDEDHVDDNRARGLGAVPGYGDDDDRMLPFPEEELDNLVKRRSHRGLALIAVLLAIILAGSVALLMFRSGGDGGSAPPIITADGSPTKVAPEASGSDGDPQSKLIYDRVDSGDSGSETDTTLLTFDDDPIDLSAQPSDDSDNAISRVILPGEPGVDSPSDAGDSAASDTATAAVDPDEVIQPIGPRRVRTVVVKPDGTIVSSEASAVDGSESTSMTETTTADEQPAAEPLAMQSTPSDDTAAIAAASGFSEGDELEITELPEVDALGAAAPADEAQPAAEAPAPAPAPAPAQQTAAVTVQPTPSPAPASTQTPSQTQSSVVVPPGGMLVQVSSQRSEESALATYRDLQARYPAILGSYQPIIQRADLGDRGIYYRVRVGPFSSNDADLLCSDLKAAGGDCILARN